MGTKTRNFFLLLFMLVGMQGLRAQDPHFSQFYANPLYLNPAFAGSNVCPRLVMNYRNQWPAIPGSYVTYNASFDMHFQALNGGLGVLFSSDRAGEGVLTTQQAALIYSVRIRVTQEFLSRLAFRQGFFRSILISTDLLLEIKLIQDGVFLNRLMNRHLREVYTPQVIWILMQVF